MFNESHTSNASKRPTANGFCILFAIRFEIRNDEIFIIFHKIARVSVLFGMHKCISNWCTFVAIEFLFSVDSHVECTVQSTGVQCECVLIWNWLNNRQLSLL